MTVLRATNGNVQLGPGGGLGALPAGAWWVATILRRRGTTTDGFECITALVDGASNITNVGTDATTSPYAISVGHGGQTATFAGYDDLVDNEFYLVFAQKATGDIAPRANVFDGSTWGGWVTGSATFENRPLDVPDAAWLLNMNGGFPWNGDVAVVAWGSGNLAEADVTDGSIGLHIGVDQWLAFAPTVLWRAANPVVDESGNAPAANETSRSGITMVAESPAWFNMDFGGAADPGPVWSPHTLAPPGILSPAAFRSPWVGAGSADQQTVTAVTATASAAPTAAVIAARVVPVSTRTVATAAVRGTATKAAPAAATVTAVARAAAAARKVTPTAGSVTGVAASAVVAARIAPAVATSAAAATAVVTLGAPNVPVSAICSATVTVQAVAVKRLPAASSAAAVPTGSAATVRRQPATASLTAAATVQAASIRTSPVGARVVAVVAALAQAGRRIPAETRCVAAALVAAQAAQPGESRPVTARVSAGASARVRARHAIPRPDTGTVTRPATGTITRPDTGIIERP
jgi:hypothetical protein